MSTKTFYRLSQVLTGEPEIDPGLAQGLMERLRVEPEGVQLDRLLEVFNEILTSGTDVEEQISTRIMADSSLRPLAISLVLLWYLGEVSSANPDNPPTEEQYFESVLWRIVRAHPPGLSGGYFGHWTYPPD